jgi:8-hydroxy-5-deazaflavin:NADPH oxidoreductase
MHVAIIGTGNVGSALGASLVNVGHGVIVASSDPEKAGAAAARIGADVAATPSEAASAADVVVIAVPWAAAEDVARAIEPATRGKVVIDASNPLRPDYSGLDTADGLSGGERIAAILREAQVVKAFNTVFAGVQGNPGSFGTTLDALFATDDDEASTSFGTLATSLGFRPVRVGPLAAARELEAMAWLNIRLQMLNEGTWQTSFVLVNPPETALAA